VVGVCVVCPNNAGFGECFKPYKQLFKKIQLSTANGTEMKHLSLSNAALLLSS